MTTRYHIAACRVNWNDADALAHVYPFKEDANSTLEYFRTPAAAVVDAINLFRGENAQLRAEMHSEIAQLRAEIDRLRADMQHQIATLQIRLISAMGIFLTIAVAVIKYVP